MGITDLVSYGVQTLTGENMKKHFAELSGGLSSRIVIGHTHDNKQIVLGIQGQDSSSFVVLPINQSEAFLGQLSELVERLRASKGASAKP